MRNWNISKKYIKKLCVVVVALCMMISMSGCGSKANKVVFEVRTQTLSYAQVLGYGYMYVSEHNISSADELDDEYEEEMTYEQYYMQQCKDGMVDMLVLCEAAKEDGVKLSSKEKKALSEKVNSLVDKYGKDYLEKNEVKASDIESVYEMRAIADKYLKQFEKENEESSEKYINVYQVTFSTARMDEDDKFELDENGSMIKESDSVVANQKEQAKTFVERVKGGEDVETVIKDYDKTVTGAKKYLKYDDLTQEYKDAVGKLSVGQISEPFESSYGIYVVKMLETDSDEHAKLLAKHDAASEKESMAYEQTQTLRARYIGNSTDYIHADLWKDFSIITFVR